MGTKIMELLHGEETSIDRLKGKTFSVDAHNILYQFLSTIRQSDGSYLTDSKGQVTSHLVGLFSRMTRLMRNDMKFIFCFDGEVPKLKRRELDDRKERKIEAAAKYEEAKEKGDEAEMRKYSQQTSRLTPEMIEEAKKLIEALGQLWIQAPSEGEAQASRIVQNGDAYAVISQDADCFLFGAPKMIKNLTISGKRKLPGKQAYVPVYPEIFNLETSLEQIGLTQDQLIVLAILVGTDFNPKGVKGIGPKKAMKLVKEYSDFDKLFESIEWDFDISWKDVFDALKNMKVSDDYVIKFGKPDRDKVNALLVKKHEFEQSRVDKTMDELDKQSQQKGLGDFF